MRSRGFLALLPLLLAPNAPAQVLTAQYNNARTGATLTETTLTPANVNSARFGKLFSYPVDGDIYAQPLFVPQVPIPGKGTHNVIFVATEHDSVYAFDAEGSPAEPLWKVNFLNSGAGVTTVPWEAVNCPFIRPEIGITPTPVIDLPTGTLYVVARTKEGGGFSQALYSQKLHALAMTTGAEKFRGPVEVKAPGFDPLHELPRAALLLAGGQVYVTWGSSCDAGPYHGWVMAYDAHTLAQSAVFNTSPDAEQSGIWQSDAGPAADDEGNVYVATGNGKFTAAANGRGSLGHDYGDSLLKFNRSLNLLDYFTPYNEQTLNRTDADLGSGGPMLIPPQPGAPNGLVLVGGKDGNLYVLDRGHLGKYQKESNSHAVEVIHLHNDIQSAPTYWSGHVYILGSGDYLTSFAIGSAIDSGKLSTKVMGGQRFANPGAPLAISANGNANGIVWLIETKTWNGADKPAILRAYDAADVTRELYNTEQNSARDRMGLTLRFTLPTVVNGRVYANAKRHVDVYGLLSK